MSRGLLGVVGKPNAGKSTFFRAATMAEAESANYPFTTIEPNRGVALMRDECPCSEFDVECDPVDSECVDGTRYVPVHLLDVAGLVPGAYEGKGLGNRFLDQLMRADALIHVVDASGGTDAEGNPVDPGTRDPARDVSFLEEEIDMWLLGILEEKWESLQRRVQMGTTDFVEELTDIFTGLNVGRKEVVAAAEGDPIEWGEEEKRGFIARLRELSKPIQVAANKADVAEPELVTGLVEEFEAVPTSAEAELALKRAAEVGLVEYRPGDSSFEVVGEMREEQEAALRSIEKRVLERYGSTGVQDTIERTVRDRMGMIVVYPVKDESKLTDTEGRVLPNALLLERGSGPRDLAYALHSDIGDSFHHAVDVRTRQRIGEDAELENGSVVRIVTA